MPEGDFLQKGACYENLPTTTAVDMSDFWFHLLGFIADLALVRC